MFQVFEVKSDKEKPKRKRKKKSEEEDKMKQVKSSVPPTTSGSAEAEATVKKRRKKEKVKQEVKQEEVIDVEDDDDDDEDEEEESCAAAKCRRPTGDEVGWVQCDDCELWFHLACVGLSSEKAESMDSYHCRLCSKATSETNSVSGTPQAASPTDSFHIDVDTNTPTGSNPASPVSIGGPTTQSTGAKESPPEISQEVCDVTPIAPLIVGGPAQLTNKEPLMTPGEETSVTMDTS